MMAGLRLFPAWKIAQLRAMNRANIGAASGIGQDIVITRGGTPLASQPVRIAARQESQPQTTTTTQSQTAEVLVIGDIDLDIRKGDEFYDGNNMRYVIYFVRPNRAFNTVAEARVR